MAKKKKKIRTEFRKNRSPRARKSDWTKQFEAHEFKDEDTHTEERISGKGELSRRRTIIGEETVNDDTGLSVLPDVDFDTCLKGRVLSVHGLASFVESESDKTIFRCVTRRLLKTLSTDQRHVVAAGDIVFIRTSSEDEGIIERIEPRHGILCRTSRGRQHVIAANVDQLVIVASAARPYLKPNLIDRYIVTAERMGIEPIVCINKIDLIDPSEVMPLVGVYGQLGYRVLVVSAETGFGIDSLRQVLRSRASVLSGQSGVGKSSLLNFAEPTLDLRVSHVSSNTQKGRHTTTVARLIPLPQGGYVVDTPGIRQFQLWDVIPEELPSFYRDIRPYVSSCRYPDCTHIREDDCAVKDAVADGAIDSRRYESYCQIREADNA